MREPRDIEPVARHYDAILGGVDTRASKRRVWARLEGKQARPLWRVVAVATVALLLVGFLVWRVPAKPDVGGFAVSNAHGFASQVGADATIEVTAGEASLTDHDAVLAVRAGTRLKRESRGVFLARGRLGVAVRHREPSEKPWQVRVAGGAIEVVGTRFDVVADDASGSVTLHEGSIRFVGESGRATMVHPGETYAWPEALESAVEPTPALTPEPQPAPEAQPRAPQKHANPHPPVAQPTIDIDAVLERVAQLRDRRQYEEALQLLATSMRASAEAVTRERSSYEMGLILADKIGDTKRACSHLARHLRDFPSGRYSGQVREQQATLSCP